VPRAIAIGDVVVPSESDGAARIYFSPRSAARFVSAVDVLERRVDGEQLARRVAIVGITGLGLGEYHATPLGESMPGSEIHAQLVENVFDGTLVMRPRWAGAAEAAAFVALGAILLWAIAASRPRHAALLAAGAIALLAALALVLFRGQRLVFDAAVPGTALMLLFGALLLMSLSDAARTRRALERVLQAQREEGARMAGELDAARRIQTATLPTPDVVADDARIDLAASMVPAREVGGDLYDFFRLDRRRLFLVVGDVAGKGLSASIFMAVSKALYKSTTLRAHADDAGAIMSQANDEVSRDNPEMLFVTAFAGVLDLDSGELRYCNAGHEPPFVVHPDDDAVRRIDSGGGPPLCVLPGFDYPGARHRMRPGELLCIVSDGVTEAQDASGGLFGSERVAGVLLDASRPPSGTQAVVERLRAAMLAFAGGADPADDATMLVLRWNGPAAGA
jgi:serine phosphatase RsbU (regulator of sigma subunit)